mgnify:CR=1 FL=1
MGNAIMNMPKEAARRLERVLVGWMLGGTPVSLLRARGKTQEEIAYKREEDKSDKALLGGVAKLLAPSSGTGNNFVRTDSEERSTLIAKTNTDSMKMWEPRLLEAGKFYCNKIAGKKLNFVVEHLKDRIAFHFSKK